MQIYLDPSQEQGRAFFTRNTAGSIVMLNLLRFRPTADYSAAPALMPGAPISGEKAYRLYMEHTLPFLKASGGELLFYGSGGEFLIGPADERWDAAIARAAVQRRLVLSVCIQPRLSGRYGTSGGCAGRFAFTAIDPRTQA